MRLFKVAAWYKHSKMCYLKFASVMKCLGEVGILLPSCTLDTSRNLCISKSFFPDSKQDWDILTNYWQK